MPTVSKNEKQEADVNTLLDDSTAPPHTPTPKLLIDEIGVTAKRTMYVYPERVYGFVPPTTRGCLAELMKFPRMFSEKGTKKQIVRYTSLERMIIHFIVLTYKARFTIMACYRICLDDRRG
jgi:hypothetical protein